MKKLAFRQGSSASSDTYLSCQTHLQSSPSNYDVTPELPRHHIYALPTNYAGYQVAAPLGHSAPLYSCTFDNNNPQDHILPCSTSKDSDKNVQNPNSQHPPKHKIPTISPKHPKSPLRTRLKDGPAASALRQLFKNKKQKTHPPSSPRLSHCERSRSHSSTESVNSQGSVRQGSGPKTRKARPSPGTGKKLANYHLIANSQSGTYNF